MRAHITLSILLLGLLVFPACKSGELDRDKATELIKEFYGYPCIDYLPSGDSYFYNTNPYEKKRTMCLIDNASHCLAKDKNYLLLGLWDFDQVTGITDGGGGAKTVIFKQKYLAVTAAGECFGHAIEETEELKITMRKYDDGWRIEGIKPEPLRQVDYTQAFVKPFNFVGEWKPKTCYKSNLLIERQPNSMLRISQNDFDGFAETGFIAFLKKNGNSMRGTAQYYGGDHSMNDNIQVDVVDENIIKVNVILWGNCEGDILYERVK